MAFADQASQDAATAAQQHALALKAYQDRQAGDMVAYAADLQELYALGVANASSATQQDLLDLANQAATVSLLDTIKKWALIGGVAIVAVIWGPALLRFVWRHRPKGK